MFTINHKHINQLLWWQLALGFYTSSTSKPKPLSGWSFQPIQKKIYCSQFEPSLQIGVKQPVWNQFHQLISRYVQSSVIRIHPAISTSILSSFIFFYMPIFWWIPHLWLPISILLLSPLPSSSAGNPGPKSRYRHDGHEANCAAGGAASAGRFGVHGARGKKARRKSLENRWEKKEYQRGWNRCNAWLSLSLTKKVCFWM